MQVMLDKGARLDWFNSPLVLTLTAIGSAVLVLFVIQELRTAEPIVNLRVLHNRTFAVGTIFTTIVMFGMYGTYMLIPLYCQQVAGYTPMLAGLVMSTQSIGRDGRGVSLPALTQIVRLLRMRSVAPLVRAIWSSSGRRR